MTRPRYDNHGTEFGNWIRGVKELDSAPSHGFSATNIDFMWTNYISGLWLYLEEKRYRATVKFPQDKLFKTIDSTAQSDPNYRGFHFLQFENTSPDDGSMWLDGKPITTDDLINFLAFKQDKSWYVTYRQFQNGNKNKSTEAT